MTQNDITILKYAVMEGVVNALTAINSPKADAPTPKAKTEKKATATQKAEKEATTSPKPKRKKKTGCYRIEDLRALYRLADAGLLHCIKGTAKSTDYPGSYIYLIEKNAETKTALAVFLTQEELSGNV